MNTKKYMIWNNNNADTDSFPSDIWHEDEMLNLDKKLDGNILIIADLGLWNGRRNCYRIVGNNLKEVISNFQGDYCECFYDGNNIRAVDTHHDGTNNYLFREIRQGVNINRLLERIYNGETNSRSMLNRYTKSLGKYVSRIYGWPMPFGVRMFSVNDDTQKAA